MTDDTGEGRLDALLSGMRFGQFASVGIVGATADTAVLVTLTQLVGVSAEIANVLSIETAILVMFAINERWTFAAEGKAGVRALGRRLVRSHLVRAAGSTTQYVVFIVLLWYVFAPYAAGPEDLPWLLAAKGLGMAVGVVLNYTLESLVTWQVHHDE